MVRFLVLLMVVLTVGCGKRQTSNTSVNRETYVFKAPVVPTMLSGDKAGEYVMEHYWDNYPFGDTAVLANGDITEQAFADFIYIAIKASQPIAISGITKLLNKASDSTSYARFTDLFDKYLHDPNAPTRNETLFISVLNHMIASTKLSDVEKIRPRDILDMALRNRVGDQAADFSYMLANGTTGRLYGLSSPYTLLFFNNPGCPLCAEITVQLNESETITGLLNAGKLKIITIYPDADIKAWREHLKDLPQRWIRGYDNGQTITNNRLYDLTAIPTLYLLDGKKRVLVKDCFSVPEIESALQPK